MIGFSITKNLEAVREHSPLVHNITNFVVMNNTANALLAAGASPVMAHAMEEVEDMSAISNALVVNIGTLSPDWVKAMELAMKSARANGKPIILDPVGAGATPYRTKTVNQLMQLVAPDVIRGNASEISALHSEEVRTKGVDSTRDSSTASDAAHYLAQTYNCTTVVSGEVDYIVSVDESLKIHNGTSLMSKVTGMGCTASALIGAFSAVSKTAFEASSSAMAIMGISGELAGKKADGPGTLQLHLLDSLYRLTESDISSNLNIDYDYA